MGLAEWYDSLEGQLSANLAAARAAYNHPGVKGDELERAFRDFLSNQLPVQFSVGHGEVIDRTGDQTGQIDVVIANEHQPMRFGQESPGLYLIEGVSALGEIKASLNTKSLTEAIGTATRAKNLRMRFSIGDVIHTNESDKARFYQCPPFFLVAYESTISTAKILERLRAMGPISTGKLNGDAALSPIDAVIILGRESLIDYGDGLGASQFLTRDSPRQSVPGWVAIPDHPLTVFVQWLHASMPRISRSESIASMYLVEATGGITISNEADKARHGLEHLGSSEVDIKARGAAFGLLSSAKLTRLPSNGRG